MISQPQTSFGFKWVSSYWVWVALFCLGLAGALPGSSGIRPLDSHEIFVAQTAEEMIRKGDFLIPTFNGELRLEKPPLSYWTAMISEFFGDQEFPHISEFEARFPSALAAITLIFLVAGMSIVAFKDRRIAWVAGGLWATTLGFQTYAHSARPEMLYTLFCSMEMLGFLWLQRSQNHDRAKLWAGLIAWGGFAGAVMAKGPLFPIFIVLGVVAAWGMRHPRPPFHQSLRPFMGLTFGLLSGIYFVYLASAAQDAGEFWVDQMTQSTEVPLWQRPLRMYFPLATMELLLPWSLLLVLAIRDIWRDRDPAALILALSSLVCLVFVSFSGKTRFHYMLPIIPFLCVLVAWSTVAFYDRNRGIWEGHIRLSKILGLHALGLAGVSLGLIVLAFHHVPGKNISPWVSFPWLAISLAGGAVVWSLHKTRPVQSFIGLVMMASLISAGMGSGALGYRAKWYLETDFAREVSRLAPFDLPVITEPDLAPYLLYYAGRFSKVIIPENLSVYLASHSSPMILIYDRNTLSPLHVKGQELLRMKVNKHGKEAVVFKMEG